MNHERLSKICRCGGHNKSPQASQVEVELSSYMGCFDLVLSTDLLAAALYSCTMAIMFLASLLHPCVSYTGARLQLPEQSCCRSQMAWKYVCLHEDIMVAIVHTRLVTSKKCLLEKAPTNDVFYVENLACGREEAMPRFHNHSGHHCELLALTCGCRKHTFGSSKAGPLVTR